MLCVFMWLGPLSDIIEEKDQGREVLASSPILCVSGSIYINATPGLGGVTPTTMLSISLVCSATNCIVRLNPLSPVEEKDQGREVLAPPYFGGEGLD